MSANPEASRPHPVFIISLDFELYWGVRDHIALADYKENILGVRHAIPAMLALFQEYGIHATWATVGFLFCQSHDEILASVPEELPQYNHTALSPYADLQTVGGDEAEDPIYYGASLIRQIAMTPFQEIGSHTFSHYYCLEPGQTTETFRADLASAIRVAAKYGIQLRSLVFPRNQYCVEYLAVCAEMGLKAVRGTEKSWIYDGRSQRSESYTRRALRLLDAYMNLTGHNCFLPALISSERLCNIPSSRFLRPYSPRFNALEPLRLRRILSGLEHAGRHNMAYHLWWHPHNFGVHLAKNLVFLKEVLECYRRLHSEFRMESLNMGEVAARLAPARAATA